MKIISVIIGVLFLFNTSLYASLVSRDFLRVPVGQKPTYDRGTEVTRSKSNAAAETITPHKIRVASLKKALAVHATSLLSLSNKGKEQAFMDYLDGLPQDVAVVVLAPTASNRSSLIERYKKATGQDLTELVHIMVSGEDNLKGYTNHPFRIFDHVPLEEEAPASTVNLDTARLDDWCNLIVERIAKPILTTPFPLGKLEGGREPAQMVRELQQVNLDNVPGELAAAAGFGVAGLKQLVDALQSEGASTEQIDAALAQAGLPTVDQLNRTADASTVTSESRPFTVAGQDLGEYAGVTETTDRNALLTSLANARLAQSLAVPVVVEGTETYDFANQTDIRTVLFRDSYVTQNREQFARDFSELLERRGIAVIISTSGDPKETAIAEALQALGLSEKVGINIIVLGVKPRSDSAEAFARLFGESSVLDLANLGITTTEDVLNNRDLVIGLAGAV